MTDWPEMREELDRKVTEEIERIEHKRSTGALTNSQAALCFYTIWQCVAGVASKETCDLVAFALRGIDADSRKVA